MANAFAQTQMRIARRSSKNFFSRFEDTSIDILSSTSDKIKMLNWLKINTLVHIAVPTNDSLAKSRGLLPLSGQQAILKENAYAWPELLADIRVAKHAEEF